MWCKVERNAFIFKKRTDFLFPFLSNNLSTACCIPGTSFSLGDKLFDALEIRTKLPITMNLPLILKPSTLSLTLSEEKVKRVHEDKQYLNERCDLCGWCINQGKKNKHGLHPHIQTPPVCSSLSKHSEKRRNCRVLFLLCVWKVIIPLTVTWSVFP